MKSEIQENQRRRTAIYARVSTRDQPNRADKAHQMGVFQKVKF